MIITIIIIVIIIIVLVIIIIVIVVISTAETHQCLQREHCQSLWAAWRRAAWRPPASQAFPVDPARRATNEKTGLVTGSLD